MLKHAARAALMACAFALASCAGPSTQTGEVEDGIVVNGQRNQPQAPVPTPMPSPPPPVMAQEMGRTRAAIGGVVAPYAQTAPQPMPGDVDRENYEDVDPESDPSCLRRTGFDILHRCRHGLLFQRPPLPE
jgi:hypothetical protein